MAIAMCDKCGEKVPWQVRRSPRLADLKCPKCGGQLHAYASSNKGKKRGKPVICVICGKVRYMRAKVAMEKTIHRRWDGHEIPIKVGDYLCWHLHGLAIRAGSRSDPEATGLQVELGENEENRGIVL